VKELQGKEVTKLDFMLFMLEKLNDLDRKKDIDPLLKKFDMFDSDETGTLNIHDIQRCSKKFATENLERKRREKEGQFSIMGLFARSTSTETGGSAKVVPGSDPDQQTQEVVEVVDNPA
jgi:Ca2+-binding EF-hand superfamily protein